MNTKQFAFVPLLLLTLVSLGAGEIKIDAPTDYITPGKTVQIRISGLKEGDIAKSDITLWPEVGTTLIPARTWGGEPFILFSADRAGDYLLKIVVPTPEGLASAKAVIKVGKAPSPKPTPNPTPSPTPEPTPNPYQPVSAWKDTMEPVIKCHLSNQDSQSLAKVYSNLSKAVQTESANFGTTGDLRTAIVKQAQPLGLQGKYPELRNAVEKIFIDSLTLENIPLDRVQASALLQTLAWAIWEAGK
jgi:hypothetical protein